MTTSPCCRKSCGRQFLRLEPGEQRELAEVVEDDHYSEEQNADEGYLIDAFLELLVEVTPHDGFDEEEKDHTAI